MNLTPLEKELVEVLKECLAVIELSQDILGTGDEDEIACENARAVIAKAEKEDEG